LKELREIEKRREEDKSVGGTSQQGFEKQNCKRPNSLGRHRNIYSGNCDIIEDIHCIKGLQFLSTSKRYRGIPGTIGNLAPFHSQKQKICIIKTKGARTDVVNVTPPYPGTMGEVGDMHVGLPRVALTQMRVVMCMAWPQAKSQAKPSHTGQAKPSQKSWPGVGFGLAWTL